MKTTGPHPTQVMSLCLLSGLGWIFRSGNPKTWSSRTEFIQGGVEEVIGTISASGGGVSHSFEGRWSKDQTAFSVQKQTRGHKIAANKARWEEVKRKRGGEE